jgi:ferredoxin
MDSNLDHVGQRPVVDATRCLGYGFCESRAPKVFVVDGSGIASVRDDFLAASEADVSAIVEAIYDCPEQAIRWQVPP